MSDAGFSERASGVLVPSNTLEKQEKTILEMDFTRLRRALKLAKSFDMIGLFFCRTCEQPIEIHQAEQLVEVVTDSDGKESKAGGGRMSLSCGCTAWTVR